MASSRLGIEMNSFLNDLQVREKKLLLGALVLIFLFVVFVYINSVYDELPNI
jgi:type II secretory pathway component PulM